MSDLIIREVMLSSTDISERNTRRIYCECMLLWFGMLCSEIGWISDEEGY